MLAFVGVGVFVGYDYCAPGAGNGSNLGDCTTNAVVNAYRTLWGSPDVYASDASTTDTGAADTGTVKTESFESEALGQTMQYAIYLPPGYDDPRNGSTSYPVVYLLPGSSGGTNAWVRAGGMAGQMDALLAQGRVRPMILVVPQESSGRLSPNAGYVDGPLGDWATYTTKDLVDEVDANYRTIRGPDGRAIAGNSEGGYGAANLGLKNPSEYGAIGSFSGYFSIDEEDLARVFGGDQNLAEANSPMSYLPQLEGELPSIYFYAGQGEKKNLEENERFAEELKARGASYDFETYPGEHNWDLWGAHLPDFLVFANEHLTGEG